MAERDRALICLMTYSLARVGAVLQMKVADYFVQGRRRWCASTRRAAKSTTFPVTTILTHLTILEIEELKNRRGVRCTSSVEMLRLPERSP